MSVLPRLLIVDHSRVVRLSLAKHLKAHFHICQESNGESAWQTLILDPAIVAVVSGKALSRLDGFGLLEKVRANRLLRLKRLPFFLVSSDSLTDEERQRARDQGVSGFVRKGARAAELAEFAADLLAKCGAAPGNALSETGGPAASDVQLPGLSGERRSIELFDATDSLPLMAEFECFADSSQGTKSSPGFLSAQRQLIEAELGERLLQPEAMSGLGILVFSVDDYDLLADRFGKKMVDRIVDKFSDLLRGKLRAADSMAMIARNRIAIIAIDTSLDRCSVFARRICDKLATARISVQGQAVALTISVGVASFPVDGLATDGPGLLAIAEQRLEETIASGESRHAPETEPANPDVDRERVMNWLNEYLAGKSPVLTATHLGEAGILLLPLLAELDQTLKLGIPLADIEQKLQEHAKPLLACN